MYHFNKHELGFFTEECDVKNYSVGLQESNDSLRRRLRNPGL